MKNKNKLINLINEIADKELAFNEIRKASPRIRYNVKLLSSRDNKIHEFEGGKAMIAMLRKSKNYSVLETNII